MKLLSYIWDTITTPFISIAVLIDESRRMDEGGTWSKKKGQA